MTSSSIWLVFLLIVMVVQEFKNALREDTIDYGIYTSSIKPKRPAPRRGSKRPVAGVYEDYDDEDYSGGARITSSSRRSSYRTRQRY